MIAATTDDCKAYLANNAQANGWPTGGTWKRTRKVKSAEGWVRSFTHSGGAQARLLEPFGAGAAGLTAITEQPGTGSTLPPFPSAPPGLQSAMRWVDAMLVLGGKKAQYANDPGAHGWTWADFKSARNDFSGNDNRDKVCDLAQRWVEEGMAAPSGATLLKSKIAWCFSSDPDYMEKLGCWSPGDGADVCMWAVDAPDEEPGDIAHPAYELPYQNQMEGVWCVGCDGASGKEAMILAWDELKAAGIAFDIVGQRKFGQDCDFDEAFPLHRKVKTIIPELSAKSRAAAIANSDKLPADGGYSPA